MMKFPMVILLPAIYPELCVSGDAGIILVGGYNIVFLTVLLADCYGRITLERLRLAVFDCDGTLVDSQHSIVHAMEVAFDFHGFDAPNPSAVRRIIGLPLVKAIGILAPESDIADHPEVAETYKSTFRDMRASGDVHEPLFQGVRETISALVEGGWLLGIATGKAMRGLVATLEPYDLLECFVTRQTADIAQGKPHPEMLNRAMADTGTDADLTVMIGDTTYDMEMARNAGTKSVGVTWGYHLPDELDAAGAHIVINEFGALPDALESLTEGKT